MPHRSDRLLHLDYHPLNVLTDGKRITGVIDWSNAHAGDPRADAARTVTILRVDNGPPSVLKSVGVRFFEHGWRHGYEQLAPLGDEMDAFYAWSGEAMLHNLAPKRTEQELEPIREWTRYWKERVSG